MGRNAKSPGDALGTPSPGGHTSLEVGGTWSRSVNTSDVQLSLLVAQGLGVPSGIDADSNGVPDLCD